MPRAVAAGTHRFGARAMGSPLRATVVAASARQAERAWQRIARDVETTEGQLSRFRASSDLTRLNATAGDGTWHIVAPRLYAMLAGSCRAWRVTGGRFDPRVLQRLEALGERAGMPLPPADGGADETPPVERRPRERAVRVSVPVDSGGLGKGLALRWALRASLAPGLQGVLIEAGGDIVAAGRPGDGDEWRIAIEDPLPAPREPAGEAEPLAVIAIAAGAVATSSVAIRSWTTGDGLAVHHLIDPATGNPGGDGLLAVTVAAADPAWAEVWTKALFLAGHRAIGLEARRRGLAAWWVTDGGVLEMTPAARARTIWERPLAARAAG